jgi:YbgC/YbaW family acyl-CoA thioester hydrolase
MIQNVIERKIMWGDLDALGIVYYPRYYEWIDACGHHFFKRLGIDVMKILEERHLIFALVETSCKYFKPGKYDQEIQIVTRMGVLNKKTFVLHHDIFCAESDQKMVEGFEKRVCMDVSDPKKYCAVDFPKDLYGALGKAGKK